MSTPIQIIIPNIFVSKPIYFKGFVSFTTALDIVIYITKFSSNKKLLLEKCSSDEDIIYGYCDVYSTSSYIKSLCEFNQHFLMLDSCVPQVKKLILNGCLVDVTDNCVIILYDYDSILKSEVNWEYNDNLAKLQSLVKYENNQKADKDYIKPLVKGLPLMSSSMFIQHTINYINLIYWMIYSIGSHRKVYPPAYIFDSCSVKLIANLILFFFGIHNKKISIKIGNLLSAVLLDLILGYLVLEFLIQDRHGLSSLLMGMLEQLINMLYTLLKWLMGAPAGLKLNNAFNKMLGKYFSYHVQLWWLFLDVTGEKLDTILQIYYYLGYLGFTFQAAVISDMICVATFHSYCIYVYAARMFNIQISGLIALLRFFVGRKYNPLRGAIDSCEYTNQELFVGTVAFTILLLLLPTTAMYYIVFTLFRVLSLLVQYSLAKLIYHIHTFPLYGTFLWCIRSPKVAGNILLEVTESTKGSLCIKLKLLNKSFIYLVSNFKPPVQVPKKLDLTIVLSNVFIGKQIM